MINRINSEKQICFLLEMVSAENLQEATKAERYGDRYLKRTRRQIEKKMLLILSSHTLRRYFYADIYITIRLCLLRSLCGIKRLQGSKTDPKESKCDPEDHMFINEDH